ncbi:MAG TPA: lysophospholipid acyltransferase family protein [Candidatus Kryptonia bacterium]
MKITDNLQAYLLRSIGFCLRRFSIKRVQRMAEFLGRFFYRYLPVRKDVALANLKLCFPEKSQDELEYIIARCYINVATVFFEFLYFPRFTEKSLGELVEFRDESRELIESALAKGKGLVMISGHFCNWELIAFSVGRFYPKRFLVIVHPLSNRAADVLTDKYRRLLGNSTVPMGNSIRAALTELHSNGIVALLADQSAAKESAPAKFCGIEVPTFQGPASFALKTGAAVHVGFLIRKEDGRYSVELKEIDCSDLKDDSEESVKELTQRHVTVLEEYVRRYPEWWLWFHRRFKHVPAYQELFAKMKKK